MVSSDSFREEIFVEKSPSIQEYLSRCEAFIALAHPSSTPWVESVELNMRYDTPKNSLSRASEHFRRGELTEAAKCYRLTLRKEPKNSVALNGLGAVAEAKNNNSLAEAMYRRAIASNDSSLEAHHNLGALLLRGGRYKEALEQINHTLKISTSIPEIYGLLAQIYSALRDHGKAIRNYRKALDLSPDSIPLRIQYMNAKRFVCDWSDFEEDEQYIRALARSGQPIPPLFLMTLSSTLSEQMVSAKEMAKRYERPCIQHLSKAATPSGASSESRPIRLGYLSCDFHDHATSYLIAELLERHDRSRFEIYGYSYGPDRGGETRSRIASGFDHFIDIDKLPSSAAARRILQDRIDILIDLKGYTQGARPEILGYRPASIQVNFLGFPGTMGASFIDYIVADSIVGPESFQEFCVEQIVQLPNCFQPNDTKRREHFKAATRRDHGLPENSFVFCSFSNPYKITPKFFDIWMRLLQQKPGSVLWLLPRSTTCISNLISEAQKRGVDPDRLIFAPHVSQAEHLARSQLADLVLDTLPVCAFTTASDALWAGVPIITCLGDTPAGRGAASVLTALGLPELVTASIEEYEGLALDLARNEDRLISLRAMIKSHRESHSLFDIKGYTRDLEAAYMEMYQTLLAGDAPRPIKVCSAGSAVSDLEPIRVE